MMKKILFLFGFYCCMTAVIFAQSVAKTTPAVYHITKTVKPPILKIIEAPRFLDQNGNQTINANENSKIVMKVKNVGIGDAIGLKGVIEAQGKTDDLEYMASYIPMIKVGESAVIEFPINSGIGIQSGPVKFSVYINEPNGFNSDKYQITIQASQFERPMIEIVDYKIVGERNDLLQKIEPFELQLLIQNTQHGKAEQIKVRLELPENVFILQGESVEVIPYLAAGESQTLVYKLIVNNKFEETEIPIFVNVTEQYGKYAENKNIVLELNQPFSDNNVLIESLAEKKPEVEMATLHKCSKVDQNIPENPNKNENRFAIIIGNEDYKSHQPNLTIEANVKYARHDAAVFKEYCVHTLGVEEYNIAYLLDGTAAQMKREISRITALAQLKSDQAEIIFYYAGHGIPDENTKEPYLVPVDVVGTDLEDALLLNDIYTQLENTQAHRITVFLDACFSGGGREDGLIVARSIRVTPKAGAISGNFVVFSATQEDEIALPYNDERHGMFTFFLLQKLQQTQGKCTYSELFDDIHAKVSEYSLRKNYISQTPTIKVSAQVNETWQKWTF